MESAIPVLVAGPLLRLDIIQEPWVKDEKVKLLSG